MSTNAVPLLDLDLHALPALSSEPVTITDWVHKASYTQSTGPPSERSATTHPDLLIPGHPARWSPPPQHARLNLSPARNTRATPSNGFPFVPSLLSLLAHTKEEMSLDDPDTAPAVFTTSRALSALYSAVGDEERNGREKGKETKMLGPGLRLSAKRIGKTLFLCLNDEEEGKEEEDDIIRSSFLKTHTTWEGGKINSQGGGREGGNGSHHRVAAFTVAGMRWMVVARCHGYLPPSVASGTERTPKKKAGQANLNLNREIDLATALHRLVGKPFPTVTNVNLEPSGSIRVSQTALFSLYIQKPGDYRSSDYSAPAWLSQTTNIVRVFGRAPDVSWTIDTVDLKAWERANQSGIKKLCDVVGRLVEVMRAEELKAETTKSGKEMEWMGEVLVEDGRLRVWKAEDRMVPEAAPPPYEAVVAAAAVTTADNMESTKEAEGGVVLEGGAEPGGNGEGKGNPGEGKKKKKNKNKKKKQARRGVGGGGGSGGGGSALATYYTSAGYEFAGDSEDLDWGLCDKDCGWCGHCLENYGGPD